jgi:hypothetical protein
MTDNNSKVDPFASLGDMSDFQPKSPKNSFYRKNSRLIPLLMITDSRQETLARTLKPRNASDSPANNPS